MSTLSLSPFEAAVLRWIADRANDPALREQLAHATVTERDYTVVGCYTTLLVPRDSPRTSAYYAKRGPFDGPNFECPAVEHGGGTQLWFQDGLAHCLEIFGYGDEFPEDHGNW